LALRGALDSNVDREERNDRWRFHMSTKFEKTEVSDVRSRRGCGVSSEAMMGVKNSLIVINFSNPFQIVNVGVGRTYRVYEVKTTDVCFFSLVEFLDDFMPP
jgi:hypothetical protein